ncbi:MAG TPA: OmpA family protein [Candidatus Krumholzibacteria bacterium]|nr:OmpA family protein [Candidatus Krumholzibacteria bacterium]
MKVMGIGAFLRGAVAAGMILAAALPARAQAPQAPDAEVVRLMDQAKDLGAKGQLPTAWWDLDQRVKQARDGGAGPEVWRGLESEARRLVNRAAFVDDMRRRKSGMESLLGRFDQALAEIGALYGVAPGAELTGTEAARDLVAKLNARNLRRQVVVDSLTVANRRLVETVGGRAEAQDSLITALKVEVSDLRRRLWETELRAGVAEADRSAAETVLTAKQQREEAVAKVRAMFTPDEAEVLQTGDGELVLRMHGLDFASGSANLGRGQDDLVARIADAVALFPDADVRLEGHTDDTGSRDANLRLSRRRAETVAAALAARLGGDAARFATAGFGPDRPVALNSTPEGRALNRRIDVVIAPRR